MRGLDKRLRELETATPVNQWGPILDSLSLDELDQLVDILRREEAGMSIDDMSSPDQALVARLQRAVECN